MFTNIQPLSFDGSTLVLAVPSQLAKDRIESRYESLIARALADVDTIGVQLRIEVRTPEAPTNPDGGPSGAADLVDAGAGSMGAGTMGASSNGTAADGAGPTG